ncbi:MAG: cation-translocating P-type ATPase [Clostridia bacterium]|nr:cation-translocating P-type ATPase [Clostridia bacterium]
MEWQTLTAAQTAAKLKTDPERGLSAAAARQRLLQTGENRLTAQKRTPLLLQFLRQFADFSVLILLAACAVSFATALLEGEGNLTEPLVILAIVLLNACIGTAQERRAERAIDALQALSAPHALVVRGGKPQRIEAAAVVPGDLLLLKSGDYVPADARLVASNGLRTQESALTGESVSGEKQAERCLPAACPPAECSNLLFASTVVTAGNGRAIVTETGMATQVGQIAHLLTAETAPETPLQQRLGRVGRLLGAGALAICAAVFLIGVLRQSGLLPSFMLAVSLAVAAIPEGLPAIVTVVLSMGVQRMAKCNAIIRHLPAVETLGAATVICSDKTGTLTQNRMTVTALRDANGALDPHSPAGRTLLEAAALCSNARIGRHGAPIGDPTETALLAAASAAGISVSGLTETYPRRFEQPFSGERKRMSVIHAVPDGLRMVVKGAPDVVLQHCTHVQSGGFARTLTAGERQALLQANTEMAAQALRVIAVAVRKASAPTDTAEAGLCFLGLIGMIDPVRPEAVRAVQTCRQAGIRPVMITGDHAVTASAIARQLGICKEGDPVLTGQALDGMDDAALRRAAASCSVFARVTPAHKVQIVKALRAQGEIVAMTGDGVNDAPALKAADIGCAMGKSGTDVAKQAADMILTDDHFATIVRAVAQGRGIFDNIKKAVHFLLGTNIGEILAVFLSSLLGYPAPLTPIQLLWVNLVTDSLPAMALGIEPPAQDIMRRKPVPPAQGFFAGGLGLDIALEGMLIGALTLLAFALGCHVLPDCGIALGRTLAFCTLSLSEIAHAVNLRGDLPLTRLGLRSNKLMLLAVAVCTALQAGVVVIAPLAGLFGCVMPGRAAWATTVALSLVPLLLGETGKRLALRKAQ